MKALVTGSTGFIGSHLVEALASRGYEVSCLVRSNSDLSYFKNLDVKLFTGDITDRESLVEPVRTADYIFHIGGITKASAESAYYKVNADGSRILYETCAAHNPGIKKIVHLSSLAAAGPAHEERPRIESDAHRPVTHYGKSKLEGEAYALQYSKSLPVTIIRPPAVYGPREKDIFFYFQLIHAHLRPILGWKKKYLSLIYVKDLISAIILAAESPRSTGQIYYVDDGRIYSWQELSGGIQKAVGKRALPIFVPEWMITIVAWIAEAESLFTKRTPLLSREKIVELKQRSWATSSEKIRSELGFRPMYDLEKGCYETAAWYRENGWLK